MVTPTITTAKNFKYDVFISYKRSDGTRVARWLRSRLLSYSLPKSLQQRGRQKLRVYLDTVYEKATEDFFSQNIEPSLRESRYLLVISTPGALAPRPDGSKNWVYREVEFFSQLPQGHNMLVALAAGEMSHPLPGDLTQKFPHIEIVDVRKLNPARFFWWPRLWRLREEFLKIVAPLLDVPVENMPVLRLEESRRRQRNLWLTLVSSFVLVAMMAGLFVWAFFNLARTRQQLIRTHLLQGQDLFALSPAHARLHFAEAVRLTDSSWAVSAVSWAEGIGVTDLGLRNDYAKARLWLGQWKGQSAPQVIWHRLGVKSVDFSPDGRRFATVSVDGYAQVWDSATAQPVGEQVSEWPYSGKIKFSADGHRFIVLSATTFALQLWSSESGKPVGSAMLHDGPVASASFHPAGDILATAGGLGHIYFWDATTGGQRGILNVDDAWQVSFSPNGDLFAVATHDNAVQVWDYARRVRISKVVQHKRDVMNYGLIASFSPEGRRLLVAVADNVVQVFDTLTGVPMGYDLKHSGAITSAVFSPDGQKVLTSSIDGTAQIWDAVTGLPAARLIRHSDAVLNSAFSPNGKLIVTASRDFTAAIWSTATGASVSQILQHADLVYLAVFSPDGSRIATASEDGTVRLWPINAAAQPVTSKDNNKSVLFSRDGSRVLTITDNKMLRIWNWPELSPASREGETVADVEEAVFSPDGKTIWLRNSRQEFQVWEYDTGKVREMLRDGARGQKEARFSAELRHVITQDSDHAVRVWDTGTAEQFGKSIKLNESDGFDITRNGEFLFVLHEDNGVEVFSMIKGTAVGPTIRFQGETKSALCSPDGQRLLVVSRNESKNYNLLLCNTATGEVIQQIPLINNTSVDEFTADGKRFLTRAEDYTAQVWNTTSLARIGKAMGHGYVVDAANFSPDGNLVLTVQGPIAQVWDATTGEPVGGPLRLQQYISSSGFGTDGRLFLGSQNQMLQREYSADYATSDELRREAELATVLTIDAATGSIRMLTEDEWLRRR